MRQFTSWRLFVCAVSGGAGSCCVPWPCCWSSSPCSPSPRSCRPDTRRRRGGKRWAWTTCPATTTSSRKRATTTRTRRSRRPWASEKTLKVPEQQQDVSAGDSDVNLELWHSNIDSVRDSSVIKPILFGYERDSERSDVKLVPVEEWRRHYLYFII